MRRDNINKEAFISYKLNGDIWSEWTISNINSYVISEGVLLLTAPEKTLVIPTSSIIKFEIFD